MPNIIKTRTSPSKGFIQICHDGIIPIRLMVLAAEIVGTEYIKRPFSGNSGIR